MSATLKATGLAAGHGARVLFSGLDLVIAPGDVVGLVGANGAGKSTLLRLLAGRDRPGGGRRRHQPAERDRRALCRRSRSGGRARPWRRSSPGAPGSPRPRRRWTRPPRRWAPASPGADDAYAAALDRWLALGGADLDERAGRRRGDVGLGVGLDTPMTGAVRRAGRPGRAGRAAALPLRRAAARRADQRPGPRRARAAGAVRHRAAVAGGDRQPRPGVPGPHGQPGRRAGPRAAEGRRVRRRLRRLPGRARGRPPARAGGVRGVRRQARRAQGARPHAAQLDGDGRAQRPPQVDGQRQDRPQQAGRDQREAGREGPADASGRSSGWRSSRSRARSGSCG